MSKVLNIGCGKDKYQGIGKEHTVIGLDIHPFLGVDVVHDLNRLPLPFQDNHFDIVVADNVLEHLDNPEAVIEDIHRILKSKGTLKIIAPHFSNPISHLIKHKNYWGFQTLDYFDKDYDSVCTTNVKFEIVSRSFMLFIPYLNWVANKFPFFYEAWLSGFIRCALITYILEAVE